MKLLRAVLLVLAAGLANGQTAHKPLSFDAASVKVAGKGFVVGLTGKMKGGPGSTDPGRIAYTQVMLLQVLLKAWDVEPYRIEGPAWLKGRDRDLYNITATMAPNTTGQQFRSMLQNLLIERFRIKLHHETRIYPGYEMVVAPGGPKLKAADADVPDPTTGPPSGADKWGFPLLPPGHGKGVVMSSNGIFAKFQNCTVAELVDPYLRSFLQQSTGAQTNHILDKTGLDGKYDYTLQFDARGLQGSVVVGRGVGAASSPDSATEPSGLPNLFVAMEKQLGLKLIKSKGFPLDTIVIDQMEKTPAEN